MNELSIAVMSTYKTVEVGLFQQRNLIEKHTLSNKDASKDLIIVIAQLLSNNSKKLNDLSYISVNQGPGPFTTLRTIIASVNGLAFATQIPLIGIDTITALVEEFHQPSIETTIGMLNAFSGEIYYAIKTPTSITVGCQDALSFLEDQSIKNKNHPIKFVGAGVELYRETISSLFPEAKIPSPLPEACSLEKLGQEGYNRWTRKENLSTELYPLYLKIHSNIKHLA